jgi:hypothetical protein
LPCLVSFNTASALPSIRPSIEVKYLISLPAGAAFDGSFIWARAASGKSVIRPNRQIGSTRI